MFIIFIGTTLLVMKELYEINFYKKIIENVKFPVDLKHEDFQDLN